MFFYVQRNSSDAWKKIDVFTIDARFEKHSECYIFAEYRKHFILYEETYLQMFFTHYMQLICTFTCLRVVLTSVFLKLQQILKKKKQIKILVISKLRYCIANINSNYALPKCGLHRIHFSKGRYSQLFLGEYKNNIIISNY